MQVEFQHVHEGLHGQMQASFTCYENAAFIFPRLFDRLECPDGSAGGPSDAAKDGLID